MSINSEEKNTALLLARIDDAVKRAERGEICSTPFLSPAEIVLCREHLIYVGMGARYIEWGGYADAERKKIFVLPEYAEGVKEYDSLLEKVLSLRTIRDTMTPSVLRAMQEEIDNLEIEIKKSSKEHGKLKKELDKVNDEYQEICKELSVLADSKIEKCDQLIDVITRHFDTLRVLFENEQISADEMLAKISEYKELYKKLEESVSETSDVLALYELQMGENSKIVDSMKKYGVKSLASALDDIDRIKKTIEDDIKAYDLILQKVVKGEEGIRAEIERRQGKNI